MEKILKRLCDKVDSEESSIFWFTKNGWRKEFLTISDERLHLNRPEFRLTPHSFRHGSATFDDLTGRRLVRDMMGRGFSKNYRTSAEYLQTERFLKLQTSGRETTTIIREIIARPGHYFNEQEVKMGWDEAC